MRVSLARADRFVRSPAILIGFAVGVGVAAVWRPAEIGLLVLTGVGILAALGINRMMVILSASLAFSDFAFGIHGVGFQLPMVVSVVAVGMFALRRDRTFTVPLPALLFWIFAILSGATVITEVVSGQLPALAVGRFLSGWGSETIGLVVFLAIYNYAKQGEESRGAILRGLWWGSGILAVLGILQWVNFYYPMTMLNHLQLALHNNPSFAATFTNTGTRNGLPRLWLGAVEGSMAGNYFVFSLPLLAYSALSKPKGWKWALIVANVLEAFLTFSRGTYLCLALEIVLALTWLIRTRRINWIVVGTLGAALLVAAFGPVAFREISSLATVGDMSVAVRYQEALTAWQIFLAHPLVGSGINTYQFLFAKHVAVEPLAFVAYLFNPGLNQVVTNNMILQLMSEQGVVGTTLFCWWLGAPVLRFRYRRGVFEGAVLVGLAGTVLSFASVGTFELVYWWVLLGLAYSFIERSRANAGSVVEDTNC